MIPVQLIAWVWTVKLEYTFGLDVVITYPGSSSALELFTAALFHKCIKFPDGKASWRRLSLFIILCLSFINAKYCHE